MEASHDFASHATPWFLQEESLCVHARDISEPIFHHSGAGCPLEALAAQGRRSEKLVGSRIIALLALNTTYTTHVPFAHPCPIHTCKLNISCAHAPPTERCPCAGVGKATGVGAAAERQRDAETVQCVLSFGRDRRTRASK